MSAPPARLRRSPAKPRAPWRKVRAAFANPSGAHFEVYEECGHLNYVPPGEPTAARRRCTWCRPE